MSSIQSIQPMQRLTISSPELLERMGALHFNHEVMIFERFSFRYQSRLVRFPYAMIAFVDRGEASIVVNDQSYLVVANDQVLLLPEQPVRLERLSDDFHARVVLMSHEFVNYITTDDTYLFIQIVRNNPLIHLQEHVSSAFCNCYDLIQATLKQTNNPYRRQMLQHIIKAFLYGVVYGIEHHVPNPHSREEDITYRFMDLVDMYFRDHHSLGFYSEQLHLSSKYISKCVRSVLGKNALCCIEERLLRQAKVMLLARQNTISQVGYELGFPDQSSFGKFFRAHVGLSPRAWRESEWTASPVE